MSEVQKPAACRHGAATGNASAATNLIADVPSGAPYLVIALLALVVIGLLTQLRVPTSGELQPGESSRTMAEIATRPSFVVAVLAGIGWNFLFVGGSAWVGRLSTSPCFRPS